MESKMEVKVAMTKPTNTLTLKSIFPNCPGVWEKKGEGNKINYILLSISSSHSKKEGVCKHRIYIEIAYFRKAEILIDLHVDLL